MTLVVEDVWTAFGGNQVHRGLSLTLPAGTVTGLIGPNGCGKSTLFDVITGAVRPQRGRVLLGGRDLSRLAPWRRYRAGLGRSFQGLELFEGLSVVDNLRVALGRGGRRRRAEVDQVLHRAGLSGYGDAKPPQLAYGQRKALSLARLYCRAARAVLLDEPAAGLTADEIGPVLDIARDLAAAGAVVCLVEHNMQVMAAYAGTVHLMAGGTIAATGTVAELMADPRLAGIFFGAGA